MGDPHARLINPGSAGKKTNCGTCGTLQRGWYDRTRRRVQDLPRGQYRVYLDLEDRRVACRGCRNVKRERLEVMLESAVHTERFARYVGRRNYARPIKDIVKETNLDWQTIKRLEMCYMRTQLDRPPKPSPRAPRINKISTRKRHVYRIVVCGLVRLQSIWFSGTGRPEKSMVEFYQFLGKRRLVRCVLRAWTRGSRSAFRPLNMRPKRRSCSTSTMCCHTFGMPSKRFTGGSTLGSVAKAARWSRARGVPCSLIRTTSSARCARISRASLQPTNGATLPICSRSPPDNGGAIRERCGRGHSWRAGSAAELATPQSPREVRCDDRAGLREHHRLLRSAEQGLPRVRRKSEQQSPNYSSTRRRSARRALPQAEGPDPHAFGALVKNCAKRTHMIPRRAKKLTTVIPEKTHNTINNSSSDDEFLSS